MTNEVMRVIPEVIRKQFKRNMTIEELARLHQVDEQTIEQIVEGIVPNPPRGIVELEVDSKPGIKRKYVSRPNPEKDERNARILELAEEGLTQRQIAKFFDITSRSVSNVLKMQGFVYEEDDKRKKNRGSSQKKEETT